MADRGRPILLSAAIYASASKQFSRPMTGHTPRKLPPFDAISRIIAVHAQFPYTRLNNITWVSQIVKHNFRKNHKDCCVFSLKTRNQYFHTNCAFGNVFVKTFIRNQWTFPILGDVLPFATKTGGSMTLPYYIIYRFIFSVPRG